jgi:hypothetical protein
MEFRRFSSDGPGSLWRPFFILLSVSLIKFREGIMLASGKYWQTGVLILEKTIPQQIDLFAVFNFM